MAKTSDALKIIAKINRTDPGLQDKLGYISIDGRCSQAYL